MKCDLCKCKAKYLVFRNKVEIGTGKIAGMMKAHPGCWDKFDGIKTKRKPRKKVHLYKGKHVRAVL